MRPGFTVLTLVALLLGMTLGDGVRPTSSFAASTPNGWDCSSNDGSGGCLTQSLAPPLTARSSFAEVAGRDGKIYVIGGANAYTGQAVNTVEVYDPGSNSWTALASMPSARMYLAAAAGADGTIYAIGGYYYDSATGAHILNTVEAYTPSTNTWATLAPMLTARYYAGAATGSDGRIYVIGGYGNAGALSTVEAYDPSAQNWSAAASISTARYALAATSGPDGKIYAIGGISPYNCYYSCATGAVELYDPASNSWTTRAPMPTARSSFDAALGRDGKIYAISGSGGSTSNEAYDPSSNTWACAAGTYGYGACSTIFLTPVPSGYAAGAAAGSDGRVYVMGSSAQTLEAYTVPGSTPATPTVPQYLSATPGNAQAALRWYLPVSDGGASIDRFDITASDGVAADTVNTSVAMAANTYAFSTTVTGLRNGSTYTISMAAHNSAGDGTAATYVITPYFPPDKVTGVTATPGNQQVTLSWTAPNDGGSPISNYTINISDGTNTYQQTAYGTSAVVTYACGVNGCLSLYNGNTYTFTVQAVNQIGSGPASDPVTVTLPVTPPDPPNSLSAHPGDGQATVTWYTGYNGGAAIDRYDLTASDGVDADTVRSSVPASDPNGGWASGTVTGLKNGTQYTISVTAHNSAGSSTAGTTTVTPNPVPGKPANLTVNPGDGQASLSWTASTDGGPISYYAVTISTGTYSYTQNVSAQSTSTTVYGLSNGATYTFTVRGVNDSGQGPDSDGVTVTLAQTAPHPPRYVYAAPGDSQATVYWSIPDSNGGSAIDRYDVTASDGIDGDSVTKSVAVADAYAYNYQTTVTGLRNDSLYTISVTAHNSVGTSTATTTTVTPEALPGKPTNVTVSPGDRQAAVSWTAPTDGGPVSSYEVHYTDGTHESSQGFIGTSGTVVGLTNGVTYTFTVRAVNAIGQGPYSDPVTATIAQTVPDPPRSLSAKPGDGQAALTWYAPANNGGSAIDRYDITATGGSSGQVTSSVTVTDASQTSFTSTLTGLTNGTQYTISVTAHNASGSSNAAITTVTPNAVPGKPTNVAITPGNGQAKVQWTVPTAGGPVSSYVIHWSDGTHGGDVNAGSGTSGTVSGLINSMQYTFAVRAINDSGSGPSSDPVTVTLVIATPGAPRNLSATPGDSQAQVSWTLPASDGGSPIDRYDVSATDGNSTTTTTVQVTDSSQCCFNTTLTGLHNGTTYTMSVTAHNASGSGTAATTSVTLSGSSVPNQPPTVNAGGGYAGISGTPTGLDKVTASDPDGDRLTYQWTYSVTDAPSDASCSFSDATALQPALTCNDAGKYSVTLTVSDGTNTVHDSATVTLVDPLIITTTSPLPAGQLDVPYTTTLQAKGGTPPYTWSIDSGALPTGLSLDSDKGIISGTPTEAGSFAFVIRVTDSGGQSVTGQFTLAPPPPDGAADTNYVVPISLPGTGDYQLTGGDLPIGLTLDPTTGDISGTPQDGGTYNFTISRQGGSAQYTITINNPVPTLSSLTPSSSTAGSGDLTLTLNGTKFVRHSTVQWNGSSRSTTYVSSTQLTVVIPAADLAKAGTANVTVFNPTPGGGTSGALTFTVNGRSTSTSVTCTPSQLPVFGSTTCTATVKDTDTGTASAPVGTVSFSADGSGDFSSSGSCTLSPVDSGSTSCGVTYAPSVLGQQTVKATYTAGGIHAGSSGTATITASSSPPPTLTGLDPNSATAGGVDFTLTVNGTNFAQTSIVQWNGNNLTTTYVSATQLTAKVPAANIAAVGTGNVTVVNPGPGGASGSLPFTITRRASGAGVSCAPSSVSVVGTTTCTAIVRDTDSGTASAPAGTVSFSTDGSGSFGSGGTCTLAAINGSSAGCAATYAPSSEGNPTITATYAPTDNLHSGSKGTVSVTVFNPPPVFAPNPGNQTVEYSDYLSFQISASDADRDSLAFSQSGLPNGLTLTDNRDGTAKISGYPQVGTGTYPVTFTVDDGHGNQATQSLNVVVTREDATVTLSSSNPAAVKVAAPGGNAPSMTFTATIAEAADDGASSSAANDGDTTKAQPVTFTLSPVGSGSPYTCTAPSTNGTVTSGGRNAGLTVTCTFPDGVVVNVYTLTVSVGGTYYKGSADGAVTVYDPSLGFATGGGSFTDPSGNLVEFGFNAKYNSSGQLQGKVLCIEYTATGENVLKSNSMGTMAIVKNSNTSYTAKITGKATYNGVGNYSFVLTAIDNGEPGVGVDQLGMSVTDPSNKPLSALTFNPITISAGNIQVPHK